MLPKQHCAIPSSIRRIAVSSLRCGFRMISTGGITDGGEPMFSNWLSVVPTSWSNRFVFRLTGIEVDFRKLKTEFRKKAERDAKSQQRPLEATSQDPVGIGHSGSTAAATPSSAGGSGSNVAPLFPYGSVET